MDTDRIAERIAEQIIDAPDKQTYLVQLLARIVARVTRDDSYDDIVSFIEGE